MANWNQFECQPNVDKSCTSQADTNMHAENIITRDTFDLEDYSTPLPDALSTKQIKNAELIAKQIESEHL
eukprot:SAG31_NODE_25173_length_466_cov_1.386921_1_plen_69_part_10